MRVFLLLAFSFICLFDSGLVFANPNVNSPSSYLSEGPARGPLGLLLSANDLSKELISKIEALEKDDLSFVVERLRSINHKYNKRNQIPSSSFASLELDFKRWASLHFHPKAYALAPTILIDEFWHNFILYTEKYTEWSNKHFNYFLHHYPDDILDSTKTPNPNGLTSNSEKSGNCSSGGCQSGGCQSNETKSLDLKV